MGPDAFIIEPDHPVLVTGATGFIGPRLVEHLLDRGFRHIRCLARPSSDVASLAAVIRRRGAEPHVQLMTGNLLSVDECATATRDVAVIFHLATARDGKSFPDAVQNSVVTTRNLLEASLQHARLRRFVNVSSFTVYTNIGAERATVLDESCPVEERPALRGDAYCFAKVKQDDLVMDYGARFRVPYVIVRPGYVYGPGHEAIPARVGIGTFGVFLHLGGSNALPLTYVDNCAEAIALAGLTPGLEGEVFNIVDDDLPSSRQFLRLYKRHVEAFASLYIPRLASYALCWAWERYSAWSRGQLPPTFNRKLWHAYWKKTRYSNAHAKTLLGWRPMVPTGEGLRRYFASCRREAHHA
jgi:nucleoside-diphosphate-sugar epimerase